MRRILVALPALLLAAACTVNLPTARTSPSGTPGGSSSAPPAVTQVSPGPLTLGGLQAEFVQVVQKTLPSVVQIQTDQGLGSGIVFDANGDIVTNYHVVQGASNYKVTTYSGGSPLNATLVGTYQGGDLAVLHVTASGLHPATFADSSKIPVGAIVMAIGNPLGLRSSVTEGIVSAFRTGMDEGNGVVLQQVIQTSAAINPGNSGGALVDLDAQVIGIPTLAATDPELGGSAAPGIGFAIASNNVVDIANQLVKTGHVSNTHRAYLGVRIGDSANGVYVDSTVSGGPADKAGIKSGDTIKSVDGQATPDSATLAQVLAGLSPGQQVAVQIQHADGSSATVQVTLGTVPAGG